MTEQDDIVKETKYFYEHLYKQEEQINDVNFEEIIPEQESIPKLTEEQCNSLEGKTSKDEVLSTLKRMKNGTSPGSDGFTVQFFLVFLERYWHSICACNKLIRKFQKRKPILLAKGRTNYIATKGRQTATVSKNNNWRPIMLLKVSYKIASGCIANRIKRVLPNIIHSGQTGFINGRCMSENSRLSYMT